MYCMYFIMTSWQVAVKHLIFTKPACYYFLTDGIKCLVEGAPSCSWQKGAGCLVYLAQLCVGRGNRNKEVGDGMQGGSRTLCCIQKIGPLRSKHVLFCFSECRNVLLCAALFQIPRIVENLTPFPILFKSLFDLNAFFFFLPLLSSIASPLPTTHKTLPCITICLDACVLIGPK